METFQPEGGGKQREWEESRAMKWYGLSNRWLQSNQGRWRVLCWHSWSRAGFFGIFWADCTTCLTPPELDPTEKHIGRSSLTRCGHCPLHFLKSEFYILLGHSLSLSLFNFKGILVDKVPCCNVCLLVLIVWLESPLLVHFSNNLLSSSHQCRCRCEEQEEIWDAHEEKIKSVSNVG